MSFIITTTQNNKKKNTMNKLQSAMEYAKAGYSVLPMNGKRPLIKFADRPPLTVDQIKHYWSKWPDANIALRTVSFFVVDVDTKNGHAADGFINARKLAEQGIITPTLQQRTASGGIHLFYKKPQSVTLEQKIGLMPGIDVKARINNYVLVPPSTTSKGKYQWTEPIRRMQEPTAKLIELIQTSANQATIKRPSFQYNPSKKWTGEVLDNLVADTPDGQRNDHLTRLCGQMVHAGADTATIWELLKFANQHNHPPLSDNELTTIYNSILQRELRQYGASTD